MKDDDLTEIEEDSRFYALSHKTRKVFKARKKMDILIDRGVSYDKAAKRVIWFYGLAGKWRELFHKIGRY